MIRFIIPGNGLWEWIFWLSTEIIGKLRPGI